MYVYGSGLRAVALDLNFVQCLSCDRNKALQCVLHPQFTRSRWAAAAMHKKQVQLSFLTVVCNIEWWTNTIIQEIKALSWKIIPSESMFLMQLWYIIHIYCILYKTLIIIHNTATKLVKIVPVHRKGLHQLFEIRYLKLKLQGIHSMSLRDLDVWHFFRFFLADSGNDLWIMSITLAEHKLESLAKDSTSFGKRTLWSFLMPMVARRYSSFAVSSSSSTLFEV